MAVNAGEVRITLIAQSAELRKSLEVSLALMKELQTSALQLNRILSTRISLPLISQLRGADRLLNRINASALNLTRSFPRQLPASFRQSIQTASAEVNKLRTNAVQSSERTRRSFRAAGAEGTRAFNRTGQAAQSMSQRIDQGNRSVTLLVAKFALLVFAIQTVANIIDSTFGAALRTIDDFEQNVIGTAAALTNIADLSARPGATFGDAFRQNLAFVRGSFLELEQIAGDFLASATDLQQAFNALAVRGVVIRREEFRLLGGIVDQIKLVTRGQSTSVQIAQELRNLFNGQVRASDQLAQLIRAQGGDVQEISRTIRQTGSLEVLQPFIRGLLEAQGEIAALLTSVREEFTATFNAIIRLGFAEVFLGTVDVIENLNAVLKENQAIIGATIGIVFNRLGQAFQFVVDTARQLGPILAFLASGPLLTIVGLVLKFGVLLFSPFRILVLIAAKIAEVTIGLDSMVRIGEAFGRTVVAIFNLFLLRLQEIFDATINLVSAFAQLPGIRDFFSGFSVDGVVEGLDKVTEAANKAANSTKTEGQAIQDLVTEIQKFFTITEKDIEEFLKNNAKATQASNFPTTPANVDEQTQRRLSLQKRLNDALRRLEEAEIARTLRLQLATLGRRRAALQVAVANENATARQAFDERSRLDELETQARIDNIELRRQALDDFQAAQEATIRGSDRTTEEKVLEIDALRIQTQTRLVGLNSELDRANAQLAQRKLRQDVQIINNTRRITRLIQDQQQELSTFAVETVSDSLRGLILQQERQLADLRRRNPALTDDDEAAIREGQRIERLQLAIEQPVQALTSSIDQAFNSIIDSLVEGSLDLKNVAQQIGQTLIKGGLQDLIDNVKESLVEGLENLFDGLGEAAAQRAAQALAVGIGLLLTVISRLGNDASFTPGGAGGGTGIESTQAVRGIIGGDTQIAIAEINAGLSEALIPTNNILVAIERNTRVLAELNLNIDPDALAQGIQDQISDVLSQALLQVTP